MHRYFLAVIIFLMFSNFSFAGRYYDARTGRFLQTDPHKENYASLSPYCYVGNNPLNRIDPNGKDIKMIYRQPSGDFGHIILQVVNGKTGKVMASWSFGPADNSFSNKIKIAAGIDVKSHQTENIDAYLKDKNYEAVTIITDEKTDKATCDKIEKKKAENEQYNLYNNNCGTTAEDILKFIGIDMSDDSPISFTPWRVFDVFKEAKKRSEEKKNNEEKRNGKSNSNESDPFNGWGAENSEPPR